MPVGRPLVDEDEALGRPLAVVAPVVAVGVQVVLVPGKQSLKIGYYEYLQKAQRVERLASLLFHYEMF